MAKTNKYVQALQQVRKLIAEGNERFICLALMEVRLRDATFTGVCMELEALIDKRLGKHGTLQTWLVAQGLIPRGEQVHPIHKSRLRITRLAWIDSLIKEFS